MKSESGNSIHVKEKNTSAKELLHLLAPIQRRLRLFRLLQSSYWGLIGGCSAALIWLLAGRFVPISNLNKIAWIIVIAGLLGGILWGIVRKIPLAESAAVIDSADQSNAVVTALHYLEEESPVVTLQREQAIEVGRKFTARTRANMPVPSQRKQLITACVGIVALVILVFIPNRMDDIVDKLEKGRELVQEHKNQLEEMKKQLEAKKLPAAVEQKMKQSMDELEKRLSNSKSIDKALEEMEKSMKEMQALAGDLKKEQAKSEQLLKEMEKQSMLAQVAKSMRQGDPDQLKNAMEELKRDVNKLSPEAKEALAKQLEQLAEQVPQDGKEDNDALRKALEAASAAAKESGDASELQEKLAELDEQLAEALAKMGASEQSLAALQAQLAKLGEQGQQLASDASAAGLAVAKGWSAGQTSADGLAAAGGADAADDAAWDEAAAKAKAAGQGQGAGSGQGSSPGQGSGAGSGQGAGGGQGGAGKGPGAGIGTGDRNLIMTPRKYEGEGDIYKDSGPNPGKGGEVQKGGSSPMIDGVSRPYEEVYNEYATEAKDALNRAPLPERMQGLVEQYFLEIQPN
jgi:hypothetical protein